MGVILSAFAAADHPGDSAAAFHVFHSPLAAVLGMDSLDAAAIHRVGLNIRRSLLVGGYAPLIADWSKKLASSCTARSVTRLMQLIELADRFDPAMTLRTSDFVAFVEATSVEQPARASIRVMTVHKAKGLEFDVVVLPQLDRKLLTTHGVSVYLNRDPSTGAVRAIHRACNEAVRNCCQPIADAYEQERACRLRDDLCTLYVAMTRPRYALHMIIPPLTRTKQGEPGTRGWSNLSYASILRRGLGGGQPTYDGEETLFQCGDPAWFETLPSERKIETVRASAPPRPAFAPAPSESKRSWPVIAPSSLNAGGRVRASDLLGMKANEPLVRGSVMHAWYEAIGFLDREPLPDEAAMLAVAKEVAPTVDPSRLRDWLGEFRRMISLPGVRDALSAPKIRGRPRGSEESSCGGSGRSSRSRWGGTLVARPVRPGRGAAPRRCGAVHGDLIDFKTDAATAATLESRVETYRPQVEMYRRALAAMLNIGEDTVRARMLFVSVGGRLAGSVNHPALKGRLVGAGRAVGSMAENINHRSCVGCRGCVLSSAGERVAIRGNEPDGQVGRTLAMHVNTRTVDGRELIFRIQSRRLGCADRPSRCSRGGLSPRAAAAVYPGS